MMDFSKIKKLSIGGIDLKQLFINGVQVWKAGRLPSAYQEVEYIKAASGIGAYINLGFSFDTAMKVRIGIYSGTDYASGYPFGAAENSGVYRCMITSPYENGAYLYGYGSSGSAYMGVRITLAKNAVNEIEYAIKDGKITVANITTGTSQNNQSIAYKMTAHLYLFAQSYNGNIRWGGERQIHYFQYYDKTDTLICDLVPCYRKSDGEIGMYDLVTGKFFTNVGTGSFTKGADV